MIFKFYSEYCVHQMDAIALAAVNELQNEAANVSTGSPIIASSSNSNISLS
jgi:hypothetical protein